MQCDNKSCIGSNDIAGSDTLPAIFSFPSMIGDRFDDDLQEQVMSRMMSSSIRSKIHFQLDSVMLEIRPIEWVTRYGARKARG